MLKALSTISLAFFFSGCSNASPEPKTLVRVNCMEPGLEYELWVNKEPVFFTASPSFRSWGYFPLKNGPNALEIKPLGSVLGSQFEVLIWDKSRPLPVQIRQDGSILSANLELDGVPDMPKFRTLTADDEVVLTQLANRLVAAIASLNEAELENIFLTESGLPAKILPKWALEKSGAITVFRNETKLAITFGQKVGMVTVGRDDAGKRDAIIKITHTSEGMSFEVKSLSFSFDEEGNPFFLSGISGLLQIKPMQPQDASAP